MLKLLISAETAVNMLTGDSQAMEREGEDEEFFDTYFPSGCQFQAGQEANSTAPPSTAATEDERSSKQARHDKDLAKGDQRGKGRTRQREDNWSSGGNRWGNWGGNKHEIEYNDIRALQTSWLP